MQTKIKEVQQAPMRFSCAGWGPKKRAFSSSDGMLPFGDSVFFFLLCVCVFIVIIFLLLVFKGICHYWTYVFFFFFPGGLSKWKTGSGRCTRLQHG